MNDLKSADEEHERFIKCEGELLTTIEKHGYHIIGFGTERSDGVISEKLDFIRAPNERGVVAQQTVQSPAKGEVVGANPTDSASEENILQLLQQCTDTGISQALFYDLQMDNVSAGQFETDDEKDIIKFDMSEVKLFLEALEAAGYITITNKSGTVAQQTEQLPSKEKAAGATPASPADAAKHPADNPRQKFAIEVIKRSHKCHCIKAINNRKHIDKDKIIDQSFYIVGKQTGMGVVQMLVCHFCKESFNITDYDSW